MWCKSTESFRQGLQPVISAHNLLGFRGWSLTFWSNLSLPQEVRLCLNSSSKLYTQAPLLKLAQQIGWNVVISLKQENRDLYPDALGLFGARAPDQTFSEPQPGQLAVLASPLRSAPDERPGHLSLETGTCAPPLYSPPHSALPHTTSIPFKTPPKRSFDKSPPGGTRKVAPCEVPARNADRVDLPKGAAYDAFTRS